MSYLTGGGRAAYRLDLEIIKSPSTSWASNSSSPSSTLSESSNCPHSISTRKPRTPRKRPNQTYNEAAALLSTAHPKIFPTKNLSKFTKSSITLSKTPFFFEPSDLLTPFKLIDTSEFLLLPPLPERPNFSVESKVSYFFDKPCHSPGEITSSRGNFSEISDDYQQGQDFEAESILDEEVEGGIDSILGNLSVENESTTSTDDSNNFCYGYPVGLGFDFGYGMRRELRAIRNVDEGDWWRFPSVNVHDVNPKTTKIQAEKKKKKKVDIKNLLSTTTPVVASTENFDSSKEATLEEEPTAPQPNAGLLLKLNYDNVLNAWDDNSSPFSSDSPVADSTGNDVQTRLAQIDLFSENGGVREASVLRYKEKRRTRLFSKKIRYQVRKVNADRRPRMKGRFVRTPNSPDDQEQ